MSIQKNQQTQLKQTFQKKNVHRPGPTKNPDHDPSKAGVFSDVPSRPLIW